jgi:hypothetical protein
MGDRVGMTIVERNPKEGPFQIFTDVDRVKAVKVKGAQHVGGFFVAVDACKHKMRTCLMTCLRNAPDQDFGYKLAPRPLSSLRFQRSSIKEGRARWRCNGSGWYWSCA